MLQLMAAGGRPGALNAYKLLTATQTRQEDLWLLAVEMMKDLKQGHELWPGQYLCQDIKVARQLGTTLRGCHVCPNKDDAMRAMKAAMVGHGTMCQLAFMKCCDSESMLMLLWGTFEPLNGLQYILHMHL
jgi:hypothetical protein